MGGRRCRTLRFLNGIGDSTDVRHPARRSGGVSKSLAMIERRVALFAHLHVNKEAAPEMYRLPIQAGGLLALG
jgi:hypothetical protein